MDTLEILRFDTVPVDVRVGIASDRDGTNQILHEDGVVVGAFRHVLFVRALEEGEDFRTGARFDERDEILDPDSFAESDLEPDLATLVVGSAFTDRLAAGAEGGDGDGDGNLEVEIFSMKGGIEAGLVVDQASGPGDGCLLFDKVGELEFEVGGVSLQPFLQGPKNGGDAFNVDQASMFLEDFDEAAHVGAFKMVRKVDGQGHGSNRILGGMSSVPNNDRIAESFDAHFVDPEVTKIRGGLGIVQGIGLGRRLFQRISILTYSHGEESGGRRLDSGKNRIRMRR